jgi:hypothetical protein
MMKRTRTTSELRLIRLEVSVEVKLAEKRFDTGIQCPSLGIFCFCFCFAAFFFCRCILHRESERAKRVGKKSLTKQNLHFIGLLTCPFRFLHLFSLFLIRLLFKINEN